jgi:DNA gyrase/topoisomerase IV subunit B
MTFLPNPKIFSMTEFATLKHGLRKRSRSLPGITIILSDMRQADERHEEIRYGGRRR